MKAISKDKNPKKKALKKKVDKKTDKKIEKKVLKKKASTEVTSKVTKTISKIMNPETELFLDAQKGNHDAIETIINSYILFVEDIVCKLKFDQTEYVELIDAGKKGILSSIEYFNANVKNIGDFVNIHIRKLIDKYTTKKKFISLESFFNKIEYFLKEAKEGKIFIYPTDTIYGIGAIFSKENAEKINKIKKRGINRIVSIIVPDYSWIENNYEEEVKKYKLTESCLNRYLNEHHAITLILSYDKPGVRILKHGFQKFISKLQHPFITTSVNISGEEFITEIHNIPKEIIAEVDYIIEDGGLCGIPSVLVDLVSEKTIRR